jgi:hypothetical protein
VKKFEVGHISMELRVSESTSLEIRLRASGIGISVNKKTT